MDLNKLVIIDIVKNETVINNIDLDKEGLKSYDLILNSDITGLNEDIIKTCKAYINGLIINNKTDYLKAASKLKEYINYNIPELTNFILNVLTYTIFNLLQSKHKKLNLFYKDKPIFNIKSNKQKRAENIILKEGLTVEDVNNITDYLKNELDIYYLKYIGFTDANRLNPYKDTHTLKNPLQLKEDLKKSELINLLYTGNDDEAHNRAKLIYSTEL